METQKSAKAKSIVNKAIQKGLINPQSIGINTKPVRKWKETRKTAKQIEYLKILDDVEDLMIKYGPDGHTDGSGQIADYIQRLLYKERKKNKLKP